MTDKTDKAPDMGRRALLRRLGLAAGAVYVAPALLQISTADASTSRPRARTGTPRRVSRPSRPARRVNRISRPSRPVQRAQRPRVSRPSRPARR